MKNTIILGAGLAGLSTAYKLLKLDSQKQIQIVEKTGTVGGSAKTIMINGNKFDIGPHRFHTQHPSLITFFKEITNQKYLVRVKKTQIYYNQKFMEYPISFNDIIFNLNIFDSIKSFTDFLKVRFFKNHDLTQEKSFEDWTKNRFGKKLFDIYFGPYTEKLWGLPSSEISIDWARDRIPLLSFFQLIKETFIKTFHFHSKVKHHHSPYLSNFFYPKGGIGVISDNLKSYLDQNNTKFYFDYIIKKISHDGSRIREILIQGNNGDKKLPVDNLISTVPIVDFLRALEPKILKPIDFNLLEFRKIIFVFLLLNKERISRNHWIYFPQKEILFNRLTEMKNFNPLFNSKNQTGIILEITADQNDYSTQSSKKQLLNRVINDLEKINLVSKDEVITSKILEISSGYPVYRTGYKKQLNKIKEKLKQIKNLYLCGRQSEFSYLNMDQVIYNGFSTAYKIMKRGKQI